MSEHTKGRLHQCSHSDKRLRDEGGEWVADTDTARRKQEECSANARRLAAAWNACEGLSTENLESIVFVGETIRMRFGLAHTEISEANTRIAKLEALVAERDNMLGKRPCQNSRCNELNAARALLREVLGVHDAASSYDLQGIFVDEFASEIRSYLDACDTLEGK